LYVGFDPLTLNNVPCNANPTGTGVYSCGGLIGTYIGIGKTGATDRIAFSEIRAYSYTLNGYPGFSWFVYPNKGCESEVYTPISYTNSQILNTNVCV